LLDFGPIFIEPKAEIAVPWYTWKLVVAAEPKPVGKLGLERPA